VSDTASRDPATDRSGPALCDVFATQANTWAVSSHHIVPDEVNDIQSQVMQWADGDGLNLIVTTGGTGFAVRDITPEVLTPHVSHIVNYSRLSIRS
jgi:gephyrin